MVSTEFVLAIEFCPGSTLKERFRRSSWLKLSTMFPTKLLQPFQKFINLLGQFVSDHAIAVFGIFFIGVSTLNLAYGPSHFDIFELLADHPQGTNDLAKTIIWDIRLPRMVICCLIGMALGTAGVLSQGLFRNPLASPSVIGTSSGGVLAAVVAMYLGFPKLAWTIPGMGFAGALITTLMVLYLTQRDAQGSIEKVLLAGFSLNTFVGALTSFVLALSLEESSKAPMILNWMMGSFSGKGWEHMAIALAPISIGMLLAFSLAYRLNVLALGGEIAQSLGVSWETVRTQAIIAIALLVGTSVSLVGLLPFLGLIVPHITRSLIGPEHRRLMICSLINGMNLTLLADFLARHIWQPKELQVGVLIALVGSPLFLWLLWRNQKSSAYA
jgi:iron complex transport system permease protein